MNRTKEEFEQLKKRKKFKYFVHSDVWFEAQHLVEDQVEKTICNKVLFGGHPLPIQRMKIMIELQIDEQVYVNGSFK